MVYASLNIAVRRRIDDQLARKATVLDVGESLDEAAKFIQGELGILKNRTSFSMVAGQRDYAVATTLQKPDKAYYLSTAIPRELLGLGLNDFLAESRVPVSRTIPYYYHFLESELTMQLAPMPDTSAPSGTLNGSHSASVTTFTMNSTKNFPTEGRGLVESEVISWTGVTSTSLTGVTRGIEGTTAATHASASTVTVRNILVYGQRIAIDREMRTYYTTGSIAVTTATTAVTGTSTVWSTNVAAGDYFGYVGAIGANATSTDPKQWYKISTVTNDTAIVLASNFTEPTVAGSGVYIISSPNPFPSYLDPVLKSYALGMLYKKSGYPDRARMEWATVERFLANARKNNKKSDEVLISGTQSAGYPRRGGRMGVTMYGETVF